MELNQNSEIELNRIKLRCTHVWSIGLLPAAIFEKKIPLMPRSLMLFPYDAFLIHTMPSFLALLGMFMESQRVSYSHWVSQGRIEDGGLCSAARQPFGRRAQLVT